MEIVNTEDNAERLKRRDRIYGFIRVFMVSIFLVAAVWLNVQKYQQCLPVAAQYEQDCLRPASASSDCRVLILQVIHTDPEEDSNWTTFQDRTGQKFEADVDANRYPSVGDTVSGIVWNGELEEVTDSGETTKTGTNLTQQAKSACVFLVGVCTASIGWLFFLPKVFRAT